MNRNEAESKKTAIIKILAIIGFIVALVFVAWLAVQAVRLAPAAFNTLASIADGLRDGENSDFTIATGANIINVGETLTISWTRKSEGSEYVFSYQCTDGVAVEIETADTRSAAACDTEIPLVRGENSVAVIFSSEKSRFVDIHYTIGLLANGSDLAHERTSVITVVNPAISANGFTSNDTGAPPETDTDTDGEPQATSIATTSSPTRYTTVPVVVTTIPVSNPNGYTDLAVTFIGVGTYNPSTKRFTKKTSLDEDERGTLRFEVKNIGTKISEVWYFSAGLPTDPSFTYASRQNVALKPNERQVVTLQFDNVSQDSDGRIVVVVTGGNDRNSLNNSFVKQIEIKD